MAEKIEQIPIAAISIDGGTQQRTAIDPAVAPDYAEKMRDGSIFPPVNAVWDEQHATYWLWDGFYRFEAHRLLNRVKIRAHVTPGTQQDAVWFSFGANKTHGVRRPPGTEKRIIEQILCNPLYSQMPITQIAEHVGTSRRYVQLVKSDLLARTEGGREPDETFTVENPPGESETGSIMRTCAHDAPAQRSDAMTVTRDGKTFSQKAHKPTDPNVPTDTAGRPIPEHLRGAMAERTFFKAMMDSISQIKASVTTHTNDHPEVYRTAPFQKFMSDLANAREILKEEMPSMVCPYCGADHPENCNECQQRGFLSDRQARCLPEAMRP